MNSGPTCSEANIERIFHRCQKIQNLVQMIKIGSMTPLNQVRIFGRIWKKLVSKRPKTFSDSSKNQRSGSTGDCSSKGFKASRGHKWIKKQCLTFSFWVKILLFQAAFFGFFVFRGILLLFWSDFAGMSDRAILSGNSDFCPFLKFFNSNFWVGY